MNLPFLSDDEILELCAPLEQPAAQVRYLASLGLLVKRKPNGRVLLARGELERVLVGRAADAQTEQAEQNGSPGQPNRAALMKVIMGGRRGAQAQGH